MTTTTAAAPTGFDVEFEEDVLAQCFVDSDYLRSASRMLDAHQLTTKHHQWIWRITKDTWTTYAEKLTPKLAMIAAKRDFVDDDDRLPYLELANKLFRHKPASARASLGQLTEFIRFVNLQVAMESAVKHLDKGATSKAFDAVRAATLRDIRPKSFVEVKWIEEFGERQLERKHRKEHPEEYVCIKTGLGKLDRIIGGIRATEMGLVVATTGVGKSIMLTHLGYQSAIHDNGTVHFSLEMPAFQVAARYDSRFLNFDYKRLKNYDMTAAELREVDERVKANKERLSKKLRIISMPLRRCDINSIRHALEEIRAEMDVKMVIVDSGDHMNSLTNYNDKRLEQAEVYWDLYGMATEDNLAVWSSTQAGKEWVKREAGAEAVSESYDKARIATIVLTLNRPKKASRASATVVEDDDEPGVKRVKPAGPEPKEDSGDLHLFLAKYRDGASKVRIPLETDFSRMLLKESTKSEDEE